MLSSTSGSISITRTENWTEKEIGIIIENILNELVKID